MFRRITARPPARKIFTAHMALLRSRGYEVLGLQAGLEKFRRGNSPDAKLAVITFDDGYRDFYTAALPVLRQYKFGATVFLPTAYIGQQKSRFQSGPCMHDVGRSPGITEVRNRISLPHRQSSGSFMDSVSPQIRAELKESKAVIEDELGGPVRSFAYPYAFPSADRAFVKVFMETLGRNRLRLQRDNENRTRKKK